MRRVVGLLALLGGLTACSDDGAALGGPPEQPGPGVATTTSTGSGCQDATFEPRIKVVAGKPEPVLLHARVLSLAPGGSTQGRRLDAVTRVEPGLRLVAPPRTPLPADLSARIRDALAPASTERLPRRIDSAWDVKNHGDTNRSFTVYTVGRVERGTWRATACGAPVNDGADTISLRGRFVAVRQLPQVRTAICGIQGATSVQRQAERLACD